MWLMKTLVRLGCVYLWGESHDSGTPRTAENDREFWDLEKAENIL